MKFKRLTTCFAILSICLLVVPALYADPAIVIKNSGRCGMAGSDANGNIIFGGFGLQTTRMENGNKVMLKCKGSDIANFSGSGQHFEGFRCGVGFPSGGFRITTDSHATVAKNGNATLTCTVKK